MSISSTSQSPGLDEDGMVSKERHDTVCKDLSMQIAKNLEMEMRFELGGIFLHTRAFRPVVFVDTRSDGTDGSFSPFYEPLVCELAL